MKEPSKKTNPNGRCTLDIRMGKPNAPQTNRREQKRECEKRYEKQRKNINTDEKMNEETNYIQLLEILLKRSSNLNY